MEEENLEQKIIAMGRWRRFARGTIGVYAIGVYAIASALAFGMGLGGCDEENWSDGPGYCSYVLDGKAKSGCPPEKHCEAFYAKNDRVTRYHCVSN